MELVTVYGIDQSNPQDLFTGVKLSYPVQYHHNSPPIDKTRYNNNAELKDQRAPAVPDRADRQLIVKLPRIGAFTDDDEDGEGDDHRHLGSSSQGKRKGDSEKQLWQIPDPRERFRKWLAQYKSSENRPSRPVRQMATCQAVEISESAINPLPPKVTSPSRTSKKRHKGRGDARGSEYTSSVTTLPPVNQTPPAAAAFYDETIELYRRMKKRFHIASEDRHKGGLKPLVSLQDSMTATEIDQSDELLQLTCRSIGHQERPRNMPLVYSPSKEVDDGLKRTKQTKSKKKKKNHHVDNQIQMFTSEDYDQYSHKKVRSNPGVTPRSPERKLRKLGVGAKQYVKLKIGASDRLPCYDDELEPPTALL